MFSGKWNTISIIVITLSLASCGPRVESVYITNTPLSPVQVTPTSTSTVTGVTEVPLTPSSTPSIKILTDTPIPTQAPSLSGLPACDHPTDVELLSAPLILSQTGGNGVEPPPPYQEIPTDALIGKDVLKIVMDIHGKSYGVGDHYDESAIIIDQPPGLWKVVSISWYKNDHGKAVNGVDGQQTFFIPLTDFIGLDNHGNPNNTVLNLEAPSGPLRFRFWNASDFEVDIYSVVACNSQPGQ